MTPQARHIKVWTGGGKKDSGLAVDTLSSAFRPTTAWQGFKQGYLVTQVTPSLHPSLPSREAPAFPDPTGQLTQLQVILPPLPRQCLHSPSTTGCLSLGNPPSLLFARCSLAPISWDRHTFLTSLFISWTPPHRKEGFDSLSSWICNSN